MTSIYIVEECGYRHWYWVHPGSVEDVIADWKLGRWPVRFFGLQKQKCYQGTCEQLYVNPEDETDDDWYVDHRDGFAHVHMDDDTRLEIGGSSFGHYPYSEEDK